MGSLLCIRWCPSCSSVSRGQVPLPFGLVDFWAFQDIFQVYSRYPRLSCIWFHRIFLLFPLHHSYFGQMWSKSSWHVRSVLTFPRCILQSPLVRCLSTLRLSAGSSCLLWLPPIVWLLLEVSLWLFAQVGRSSSPVDPLLCIFLARTC